MVKFTNDLLTGVATIDSQHKELFERINTVVNLNFKAVTKEETEKTLKYLSDYVVKHFSDEEGLQRKHNYPKYEEHRKMHQEFINTVEGLITEYKQNGPSATFTLQVNRNVINWIVRHIKNVDVELGKFINSKG